MNLDKAPEFLTSVQAYLMKKLRVQLRVKEVEVGHDSKVFCDIEEKKLWLKEGAELIDVSVELARSFGLPLEHAFHLSWTLGQTNLARISDNFGRFGISIIELPREEEIYKPKPMPREESVEKPLSIKPEEIIEPAEKPIEIETQEAVAQPLTTEVLEDSTTQEIIEDWVPECPPDQAETSSEEYIPKEIPHLLVTREDTGTKHISIEREQPASIPETRELKVLSEKSRFAIGNWGEKYALRCLKGDKTKEYPDAVVKDTDNGFVVEKEGKTLVQVIWLNKNRDQGIGHDIELLENNVMYFIEVKSTKTEEKDWFDVSRGQWALMQEKGDKFYIYRVYGAGTKKPLVHKIRDPAKLWREGGISAYPVRIQL
jgi:hypothetical protein